MHQHYKAVFIEDIYNMNLLAELTLSLLFALGLSNYLSASFLIQDVLSVVRSSFIHRHSKNRKLESSGGRHNCLVLPPSGMESDCLMRPDGRRDTVTPSFQVRAVPLWKELLPCHILTDGWSGQNNHSNWVLSLSKASDLPDHHLLVTSSSWSWPVWVNDLSHWIE